MSKKEIGFGIVGGNMGLVHALGLKACKDGKLIAVCDRNVDMLRKIKDGAGVDEKDCYKDFKDLLARSDIDAVVIATPDQIHADQTVEALEAGKHVLCEKPMAITIDECKRMIAASDRTGKKLMVGQIGRYAPGFITAKKLIDSGEIGDLFFVESEYAHDYTRAHGVDNWRVDPVKLRHPVLGGGCHAVDLLRWIAGNPYEVCAFANRKVLTDWPVDDCTIGIMRFPGNVIGKVFVSIGCKRTYTMRSVFYGTKGTIVAENKSNFITVYKDRIGGSERLFQGVNDQLVGLTYPVEINHHNTMGELAEFIDIIQNEKPVITDGREGASTAAVCLALVESAAKNGENIKPSYNF